MARCAVRAAPSGATCGVIGTSRVIRSARSDAGGDIAARCPYLARARVSIARRRRAMAPLLKLRLQQHTNSAERLGRNSLPSESGRRGGRLLLNVGLAFVF